MEIAGPMEGMGTGLRAGAVPLPIGPDMTFAIAHPAHRRRPDQVMYQTTGVPSVWRSDPCPTYLPVATAAALQMPYPPEPAS